MISYCILAKLKSYWYHFNCEVGRCSMKTFNPYPLRIDEELMEELKEMAEAHSRSVNKEIEYLIKEAIKKYRIENPEETKQKKKTS